MDESTDKIGDRVKHAREMKGWSQAELANKSGINQSNLSRIENDQRHDITIKTARKLAKALDIGLNWLIGEE